MLPFSHRRTLTLTPSAAVVILLIVGPLFTGPLAAQTVRGRLLDNQTEAPVVNGTVTLLDSLNVARARVLSDSEGRFVLTAPSPGQYTLRAGGLGYRGGFPAVVTLEEKGEVTADIYLQPSPIRLDPLEVSAERVRSELERQGFYERRERRRGFFLNPEQLRNRPPVTEVELVGRAPFVEIDRTWTGSRVRMREFGDTCNPMIFVDNYELPDSAFLEDYVNAADIVALEVFRGYAEIPQDFAVGWNSCGVIMIWTVWSELRSRRSGGGQQR